MRTVIVWMVVLTVMSGCVSHPVIIEVKNPDSEINEVDNLKYTGSHVEEVLVYVSPQEPTQITFPTEIWSGYKRKASNLSIDRKGSFLVVFANEKLSEKGEAILVIQSDGVGIPIRILPADASNKRDAVFEIKKRESLNKGIVPSRGCITGFEDM